MRHIVALAMALALAVIGQRPALAAFCTTVPCLPPGTMFYTGAETQVGGGGYENVVGPAPAVLASIPRNSATTTSDFYNASATRSATSSADLATGTLHGFAGITQTVDDGQRDHLYYVVGGAEADAEFGEVAPFTVLGANPNTRTTISFSIHLTGSFTHLGGIEGGFCRMPSISLQADVGDVSGLLRDYDSNVIGWGYFSSFGFTGDYLALTDTTNLDVTLDGAVTLEGAAAVVPVELDLRVHSGVGVTDFGDTVGFSFDSLPPGVSFSSASGQFLKGTAVPEPASTLSVFVGFMATLVVRRRAGAARSS